VKDIRSFLGFANFYRPFIPRFAELATPLTRLTKKDEVFNWDDNCRQSFEELKNLFVSAPILVHFEEERETIVETDASG
jgi:hypothetical protein